tara:strand:- start:194 stop:526 length:333 start_codon:yes stop_codon:yes gene_type:complete
LFSCFAVVRTERKDVETKMEIEIEIEMEIEMEIEVEIEIELEIEMEIEIEIEIEMELDRVKVKVKKKDNGEVKAEEWGERVSRMVRQGCFSCSNFCKVLRKLLPHPSLPC